MKKIIKEGSVEIKLEFGNFNVKEVMFGFALRWAGMRLAEYIGKAVAELQPEEVETYELEAITKRSQKVQTLMVNEAKMTEAINILAEAGL
ncbi:glycine/sarcosine/betaine reductase component B subunit [Alkaliphilus transvaalensis]|uniref:glycine/sarcosine/betaine reductase component B subunit n=1 Tax=Alkaliphilus transvaalensis TaxID=114628 RepID=UPI00047DFDE2|nr:glycine/sarcosine/betaine reductase component B subunit [Alkaliphilus transvaalensis]